MNKTVRKLDTGYRKLAIDSPQVDQDSRTVTLIWSTGSKGLRRGWEGDFYEELSMDPKHVDLKRLQSGNTPLLASHDSSSLDAVIGVVKRAWIDKGVGKAEVMFSADPDADRVYQKVKEGVLRNISIGYTTRKMEDVTRKGDKIPTYRAVDWEVHEVSVVPIGFDSQAFIQRNKDKSLTNEVEIISLQGKHMSENQNARKAEISRLKQIRQMAKEAELTETQIDNLLDDEELTVQEAEVRILRIQNGNLKFKPTNSPAIHSGFAVDVGSDNHSRRMELVENALLHRINPKSFKAQNGYGGLQSRTLMQQMEFIYPKYMMESDHAYAKRMMTTSDMPLLLANLGEKALAAEYQLAEQSYKRWIKFDTVRNFKELSKVKTSEWPSLQAKPEGAEYEMASISEDREVVQLEEYGIMLPFSSRMFINDDLSGLQKFASNGALAAVRKENALSYAALTGNAAMNDGENVFSVAHANIATSAAISIDSVAEAFKLMRKQKSLNNLENLNLSPKYLVVGPDNELKARQLLASINPNQVSSANPFAGALELVVDNEISDNDHYFIADQNQCESVVLYHLQGQETPSIATKIDFNTDSVLMKVNHKCVAKVMDYRGLIFNEGA